MISIFNIKNKIFHQYIDDLYKILIKIDAQSYIYSLSVYLGLTAIGLEVFRENSSVGVGVVATNNNKAIEL